MASARYIGTVTTAALVSICGTARSQVATLVTDLNTSSSAPAKVSCQSIAASNGFLFAWMEDPCNGKELWAGDGSAMNLLVDIRPGTNDGFNPAQAAIVPVAGGVVFVGTQANTGGELWFSDGTTAGTHLVTDLYPGSHGGTTNLAPFGDLALFTGWTPSTDVQLWITDGTLAGTQPLTALPRGSQIGTEIRQVGDLAFFTAQTAEHGQELWVTDGTTAGTHLVSDLQAGAASSNPHTFSASGSHLFFFARLTSSSTGLWITDGTAAGTTLVMTIPGGTSTQIRGAASTPDGLYFSFGSQGTDTEIWYSAGTPATTSPVLDINPGLDGSSPRDMAYLAGALYFTADDGVNGRRIYRSDGTPAGTAAIAPAPQDLGSSPQFFGHGSSVLFISAPDASGRELWITDGTPVGTHMLLDANPGAGSSFLSFAPPVSFGDKTFFPLVAGNSSLATLFKTDGTPAGTAPAVAHVATTANANPTQLTALGDNLVFTQAANLYITDGTAAGTALVHAFPREIWNLTEFDGLLYFSGPAAGWPDTVLWTSDGTPAGTGPVSLGDFYNPGAMTILNGKLILPASHELLGNELIATDGTAAGTVLLGDIAPGTWSSYSEVLTQTATQALFTARTEDLGQEFYVTDGTPAGTMLLADIRPGRDSGANTPTTKRAAATDDRFFFIATEPGNVDAIWTSDGTPAGTTRLGASPGPQHLTAFDGRCYFAARGSELTAGIWAADATGMSRVFPLPPVDDRYRTVLGMIHAAGKLYFTVLTYDREIRLYSSDGTESGTVEVGVLWPYEHTSLLLASVGPDGPAYVSSYTPEAGWELFRTDGSEGSLIPIEANAGPSSSAPLRAATAGERFYFVAAGDATGRELWTIETAALMFGPSCPADFNRDGFIDFFDYDDFVSAFETGLPSADINRDQFIDFFDYDDFVAVFEIGC